MINFLNVSYQGSWLFQNDIPLTITPFPSSFFSNGRQNCSYPGRMTYLFPPPFINFSKKPLSRLDVDYPLSTFRFDVSLSKAGSALELCKIDRGKERRSKVSLSLSLSLFNGYPAERLAKRHNVSPFKAGPARMQRPGVDVTRIGETRSTAHANAQATKI